MKRDLFDDLMTWKASPRRKPLLVRGARQTGKTYLLREFGRSEYERTVYLNFEEDPRLSQFFERDLDPKRILAELAIYFGHDISPDADLVIFDEIQSSNGALNSLKYFQEDAPTVHIIGAGSLLGVKLSAPGSFPVGKVNFLDLHPMTFGEFLDAMGGSRYRALLHSIQAAEPLTESLHRSLIDLLRTYFFVGGMPEAVRQFSEDRDAGETRRIQREIIDSYVLDFAKHAPTADIPKLTLIWDSIPKHLARENKKFTFSAVRPGARAREFDAALIWLEDAGLIHRANAVTTAKLPLSHYADISSFKVFPVDVGLLGAMARVPEKRLVEGERLFNEYEGAFVESYVAQELIAHLDQQLYYWRSNGGKAEIDFLLEFENGVFPLEVKAGVNPRSKSLKSFGEQFGGRLARMSLMNLNQDGNITNFPLYAVSLLRRFLSAD